MHASHQSTSQGESRPVEVPACEVAEVALAYEWTTRVLEHVSSGTAWGKDLGDDPMGTLYEIETLVARLQLAGLDMPVLPAAEGLPHDFMVAVQQVLSALIVRH